VLTYFTMLLLGLHYLYKKGIKHHDLNPSNILIDQLAGGYQVLKISGFNISTLTGFETSNFDEEVE
jgi:serine/threonine protein kinase